LRSSSQFISKKTRIAVYTYLFKEGTLVAKKDYYKEKHSAELDFANLEVIGLLRSFKSKGYVTETFNWCHYYWYLTDEGIKYLRTYLALPEDCVPATLKKPEQESRPTGYTESREKKTGPGGDFKPRFERGSGGDRGGDRGNRDGYRPRDRN
jgi:small subunit ribosomal protein S10e